MVEIVMVEIVKTFACGERICNLRLHLEAVDHMLPYFTSSDHYNYASYVQIYFQQICQLQHKYPSVCEASNNCHFTMRRQN